MKIVIGIFSLLLLASCYSEKNHEPEIVRFDNIWSSPIREDAKYNQHFVNEKDEHLYVLNKTAWAYFACEYPEKVLPHAALHGANVIRVCLEGTPYLPVLGYDLWPWGGTRDHPDYESFNQSYWDEVERRIQMAGEKGIGIDLVLYFTLVPTENDVAIQQKYWDYAIQRLSKYSNLLTWEIMNEEISNEKFQDHAGQYFKDHDPHHHLVCSSDGTTEDALWPDKAWMDMAIVHTCTGNQDMYDLEHWYLDIAQNLKHYGKPAFNNESGREKRHKNDDPVHRRKQGWLFANSGAYWTWHSWDGCEGINDTTYFMDGWQNLPLMRKYYESVPFWTFQPNFTICNFDSINLVHTTLSTPSRVITILYCCTRESGKKVIDNHFDIRIKNGVYTITFIDPATFSVIHSTRYTSKNLRNLGQVDLPDFMDDLLVEIKEIQSMEKTVIEGTQ